MDNSDIKQHVSIEERNKWDKVVVDFAAHLGSRGTDNHGLADGTIAGFSEANFTAAEKTKLAGIEDGALNNPHPETHSWEMITGLSTVGHTGSFTDLLNVPKTCYTAAEGNCNTINGVTITLGSSAPSNPQNLKNIWFDTNNKVIKFYSSGSWVIFGAAFL
jgi:hypothetical protein